MIERRTFERLTLAVFVPARLALDVEPTASGRRVVVRTRRGGDLENVAAALDGPMFADVGGGRAELRFRYYARGKLNVASTRPDVGATVAVVDGLAVVVDGARVPAGASVAVQGYPALVRQGENVTRPDVNTERVWRAALAVMSDGRLAFVVGRAYALRDFAAAMIRAGAVEAVYTDGGRSAALYLNGTRTGDARNAPVASWLVVRSTTTAGAWLSALGIVWALWRART